MKKKTGRHINAPPSPLLGTQKNSSHNTFPLSRVKYDFSPFFSSVMLRPPPPLPLPPFNYLHRQREHEVRIKICFSTLSTCFPFHLVSNFCFFPPWWWPCYLGLSFFPCCHSRESSERKTGKNGMHCILYLVSSSSSFPRRLPSCMTFPCFKLENTEKKNTRQTQSE